MQQRRYHCLACGDTKTILWRGDERNEVVTCEICYAGMLPVGVSVPCHVGERDAVSADVLPPLVRNKFDVAEHIAFCKVMIAKYGVEGDRKSQLERRLHTLEARTADTRFRLAVLGEFASGKSTYINGLIRWRLLKSARVATTASATHLAYGAEFSVTATFIDGTVIRATETQYAALAKRVLLKSFDSGLVTLKAILDLLTADQKVADTVRRIDITLPNESLRNGLVIIDTPGISAGVTESENHLAVTRAALDDSDAAIVLIPSAQPMAETLIRFLDTDARRFLNRCIFVVTATDNLDEDSRDEVLRYVRAKLAEKMGLKNAIVLESAAITVLPMLQVPASKAGIWSYWQREFELMERRLLEEMRWQRPVILAEGLIHLLHTLLAEIDKDVKARRLKLDQEAQFLKANSVTSVETVLSQVHQEGKRQIEISGASCRSTVTARQIRVRANMKSAISKVLLESGLDLVYHFEDKVQPKLIECIESEGRAFVRWANSDMESMRECCEAVCEDFTRQFHANYHALKGLGFELRVSALKISSLTLPAMSFSSLRLHVDQAREQIGSGGRTGAIVGGMFGFLLGGPLGAMAGAALGGSTGIVKASDMEKFRDEIRVRLDADIDDYVSHYTARLTTKINSMVLNVLNDLSIAVDAHIDAYSTVIGKVMAEHARKHQSLLKHQQENTMDGEELRRRAGQLEALQNQLSTH